MPDRNELGIARASWGGSWVGCGHSGSEKSWRGLRSAEEGSDGEGGQPLGGGWDIGSVRLSGAECDELSGGTATLKRNDS
jgi:hypothetical protein